MNPVALTRGALDRVPRRSWWHAMVLVLAGCGGSTSGFPSGDASAGPGCGATASACQSGNQCCSGICDPTTGNCGSTVGRCIGQGGACASSTDCCSLTCNNGVCGGSCAADGQPCGAS